MTASLVRTVRLWATLLLSSAVIVPQAGCTRIMLISSYDEVIDHSATELQRRMENALNAAFDVIRTTVNSVVKFALI